MITVVALILAILFLPAPWSWLLVVGAFLVDVAETVVLVRWSKRRRSAVGVETLLGRRGVAASVLSPTGQIRVDGEIWAARSEVRVDAGSEVVVTSVDGLVLHVEPSHDGPD